MGMIQQNINQGISIAGFLYSQTDTAKTQQEIHRLSKSYKTLNKAYINYTRNGEKEYGPDEFNPTSEEALKYAKKKMEVAEQLESIKPDKYIQLAEDAGGDLFNAEQARKTSLELEAKNIQKMKEKYAAEQEEDAEYQQQAEEDEAELAAREQSAPTSPTEIARQKADESLAIAQQAKRETINRKKGFTSQRYGTNKTKITFGGKV